MPAERIIAFSDYDEEAYNYTHSVESHVESFVKGTEDEVFLLQDTGFEVAKQVGMYFRLKAENPHLSNLHANQIFATRTDGDIRAYEREFLARQSVLINHLSSDFVEGEYQIVGTKYNQRLLDVIAGDERRGAIKNAITELEHRLQFAPPDTLFAIHSPSGWAKDGHDNLPDDQIYLYKIDEHKNLSAITLRLSLSLEEHEAILQEPASGTYKDRLVRTSSAIVHKSNFNFEDYLNLIEANVSRDVAWIDTDKNGELIQVHTFADVREKLANLPDLLTVDEEVDAIAQSLHWYLRADIDFTRPENTKLLIRELGKAALDMQDVLARKKGFTGPKNYVHLAKRARELGGCVASAGGPKTAAELIKMGYTERACARCGKKTLCGPCSKKCVECEKEAGIY